MFIPFQQIFFSYAEDLSINLVEGGVITCLFLSSGNEIFHTDGSFIHSLVKLEGRFVYLLPSLIRLFLGGSPIHEFC